MKPNYILQILITFPDIASGRKNFKYYEKRVKKNLMLTNEYLKKRVIIKKK